MKIVNVVGGLGSQMMAYSLHLALKKAYPTENVICDFSAYHKRGRIDHNGSELRRVFGLMEDCLPSYMEPVIHSRGLALRIARKLLKLSGALKHHDAIQEKYNYDKEVFSQKGVVIYHQCWTSWKYFTSVEKQVREAFTFPPIKDKRNIQIRDGALSKNSVSIHVRRGDYIGNSILGGLIDIIPVLFEKSVYFTSVTCG